MNQQPQGIYTQQKFTLDQAKSIYTLHATITSLIIPAMELFQPIAYSLSDNLLTLGDLACRYVEGNLITEWLTSLRLPLHVMPVLVAAPHYYPFLGAMLTSFGLSKVSAMTEKDATGFVDRGLKRFERTGNPGITTELKNWLARSSGRREGWFELCQTREELIDMLSARRVDPVLADAMTEVSEIIIGSIEFGGSFANALNVHMTLNESGEYAKTAKQKIAKSNSGYKEYSIGRLTAEDIGRLARRDVAREFVESLWMKSRAVMEQAVVQ